MKIRLFSLWGSVIGDAALLAAVLRGCSRLRRARDTVTSFWSKLGDNTRTQMTFRHTQWTAWISWNEIIENCPLVTHFCSTCVLFAWAPSKIKKKKTCKSGPYITVLLILQHYKQLIYIEKKNDLQDTYVHHYRPQTCMNLQCTSICFHYSWLQYIIIPSLTYSSSVSLILYHVTVGY